MTKTLTSAIAVARRTTTPEVLRAVAYLRVSTEEQAKGYGIAYTEKKVLRHFERKGWVHVGTYSDEGYSGSLEWHERPDLKRLMEDARKTPRPFDLVGVQEARAIGRKGKAFWPWVWKLAELGVFVAVAKGDYDNTTDEGESRMRKDADRAEDERVIIRDRTQGGVQEKAEDGLHPGGTAPFGWKIKKKGKKGESYIGPDKKHGRPMLHEAWHLIVEKGLTPGEVEDRWNREGRQGPTKDYWPKGSLRHILTGRAVQDAVRVHRDPDSSRGDRGTRLDRDGNPRYGDTVIIKIPPMFTGAELRKLNAALARTARLGRAADADHALSTRLVGACGKHYTGVSNVGRNNARMYRCSGKSPKDPRGKRCTCQQIDADTLEAKVWGEVCKLLGDPTRLSAMAEDWIGRSSAGQVDYDARAKALEKQLAGHDDAITAAVQVAAREKDAAAAIAKAVKALKEDRAKTEKLLGEVLSWKREAENTAQRGRDLKELAKVARERLHDMGARQQAEVLELLDVRVTMTGPIQRKTRSDDGTSLWFRERGRTVPRLTDEAWEKVAPIFAARKGRRPADPRALLAAMLLKARTGCSWDAVPEPRGSIVSAWKRWLASGLWAQLMDALKDMPGDTPPADGITLPPLRVEGQVDPRLFVSADNAPDLDTLNGASRPSAIHFQMELAA